MRGFLMMLAAGATIAVMQVLVRQLSQDIHAFEIAFFRNLFGLLALTPWFLRFGLRALRTDRLGLLVGRGAINSVSMLLYFLGLSLIPFAEAVALASTAPLFATIGAILLLGETVRLRRWTALLLGFAGALVIIRPGFQAVSLGAAAVLGSALLWAATLIIIKVLSRTENSVTVTIYMGVVMTPLTLLAALPVWTLPDAGQLAILAVIGALGTLSQLALTEALRTADTSAVLPLDFTKLLWSALLGFLVLGEVPTVWTIAGGALIVGGSTYIAWRESRLGRPRGAEPEA